MTMNEMEKRYQQIVNTYTMMTDKEKTALLNRYAQLMDGAEIGMSEEYMTFEGLKVYGAIELLKDMGRFDDDEDLVMLINEIESYAGRIRNGEELSPWDARRKGA